MRTVLKIVLFATLVISVLAGMKRISKEGSEVERFNKKLSNLDHNSIILIGSSRVRRGINPKIIERHFENHNAHNLGIDRGTFLINYILADHILTETEAQILLVELSPIKSDFTSFSSALFNDLGISLSKSLKKIEIENWVSNLKLYSEVYNSQFVNTLSINLNISSILGTGQKTESFGFRKSFESNAIDESSFLNYSELSKYQSKYDLKQYELIIEALTQKANSLKKQIFFLIPMTYKKSKEKDIVISLFLKIANRHKVELDSMLFDHISDKNNLLNANHFNSKGATIYTEELVRLIKKQNLIPPPNP